MRITAYLLTLGALVTLLVLTGGCVKDFTVGSYVSRGVVKEPEPPRVEVAENAMAAAIRAAVPVGPIFDFLAGAVPFVGQTRREAIRERMNYVEFREWVLFKINFQDCEKEGEK